jgi:hypothetical protein
MKEEEMASDDIKALRGSGAGLDAQLRVVVEGRVVCCVGLLTTMYFPDGGTPEVRERVCQALDVYKKAIGDKFVWGSDPNTGTPRRLAGTQIDAPRTWMAGTTVENGLSLKMHGGRNEDDADPHFVRILARSLAPKELSYFSFGLPFEWITTHASGVFTKLIVEISEILEPTHGYGGLAVVPFVNVRRQDSDFGAVIALAARFRGLEVDLPASHCIYLAQEDRIKGINWLTILDRKWVDRLGGAPALTEALGPGIPQHRFKTGVVIQAGPRPLFGDVHSQEPMPHYKQVASALKPIRIDSVRALSSPFGFDRDRTDKWLARFD